MCAAIHAWPLDWGLPSEHGWAPDELTPAAVLEGLGQRFSYGWHSKYPPLHHAVLASAYAPWLSRAPDARRLHILFRVGRFVSLLMAAGTVVLVYLCGREVFDHLPTVCSSSPPRSWCGRCTATGGPPARRDRRGRPSAIGASPPRR